MNPKSAIKILLYLSAAYILFHLSIVFKVVPYEITWGGRLKTDSEMYVFESISIFIILLLIFILLIKGKYVNEFIPLKIVNIVLWIFFALFALNTVGNIFAETNFEKYFILLTLPSAILIWIILRKGKKQIHE